MFGRKSGKLCPLWRAPCKEHGCCWYEQIKLIHPQTGVEIDKWDCVVKHQFTATMGVGKEASHTTASVDKLHNGLTEAVVRQQKIELIDIQSRVLPAIEQQ